MAIFSFNQDFPYSIGPLPNYNWMFLNIPMVQPKRTEISADMDIETISALISDKMIEFIKKSFETNIQKASKSDNLVVLHPFLLQDLNRI